MGDRRDYRDRRDDRRDDRRGGDRRDDRRGYGGDRRRDFRDDRRDDRRGGDRRDDRRGGDRRDDRRGGDRRDDRGGRRDFGDRRGGDRGGRRDFNDRGNFRNDQYPPDPEPKDFDAFFKDVCNKFQIELTEGPITGWGEVPLLKKDPLLHWPIEIGVNAGEARDDYGGNNYRRDDMRDEKRDYRRDDRRNDRFDRNDRNDRNDRRPPPSRSRLSTSNYGSSYNSSSNYQ